MKKAIFCLVMLICAFNAEAQFAPPAGQTGTSAMHKDSSAFITWATGCIITRGYRDVSDTTLGYASAGDSSMAIGIAGTGGVVSLGDNGTAILTFLNPITNGAGYDFAVFENGFSDTFLELAFVEVSSDGINYFRFPATSNTQDTLQIGSFGAIDATQINNFAGKYRANYGTPFDLQELQSQTGLDVNNITHVKLIDVIGCIQDIYATYDSFGNKVNDPWSTAFASGGFDLDGVGVINQLTDIFENTEMVSNFLIYPNPAFLNFNISYELKKQSEIKLSVTDITGNIAKLIKEEKQGAGTYSLQINMDKFDAGIYFIQLQQNDSVITQKIILSK